MVSRLLLMAFWNKISELSSYGIIHTEVGLLEPVIPTEFEHNEIKGMVYDTN